MIDSLRKTREVADVGAARFDTEFIPAHRPVVLRGLGANWPAVAVAVAAVAAQGPLALARYLHGFTRGTEVEAWIGSPAAPGRFGYAPGLTGFDFARQTMPIGHLFAAMMQSQDDPTVPPIYAGALNLAKHFPGLAEHTPLPLLANHPDRLVSLWIGNGSRTPAHWDLAHNLAITIAGTRRFLLFPPDQLPNLYVGPLELTPAGQPISLVDPHAPDFDRFPRYREALAHAEIADLAPGDALYVPSMWWHHVETPGRFGAQINVWWRDAAAHMVTPLYTLMHALLTMRDLPAPERGTWKGMFDYYVFRTGPDPAGHLPEAARGMLGPITPEIAGRIRAVIAASVEDVSVEGA